MFKKITNQTRHNLRIIGVALGVSLLALTALTIYLLFRTRKEAQPTPGSRQLVTALPSPSLPPKETPKAIVTQSKTVSKGKTVTLTTIAACPTPIVVDWASEQYNHPENIVTQAGSIDSQDACYLTIRLTNSDLVRFVFPDKVFSLPGPGAPVTVEYHKPTGTVGFVRFDGPVLPTPTPTATPTPTPLPTATPTPTPKPSPTATPVPCCASGARPGASCRCCNGYLGNSGKCR